MVKVRFTFYITKHNHSILKRASKRTHKSMGDIVNALILQKLDDPVLILRRKARSLAKEMAQIQEQIAELEKIQEEKMKGGYEE